MLELDADEVMMAVMTTRMSSTCQPLRRYAPRCSTKPRAVMRTAASIAKNTVKMMSKSCQDQYARSRQRRFPLKQQHGCGGVHVREGGGGIPTLTGCTLTLTAAVSVGLPLSEPGGPSTPS